MHPRLNLDTIVLLGEDKEPAGGINPMAAEGPMFSELEVIDEPGTVTMCVRAGAVTENDYDAVARLVQ